MTPKDDSVTSGEVENASEEQTLQWREVCFIPGVPADWMKCM